LGAKHLQQLRRKGWRYWLRVAVVLALGLYIGHELGQQRVWIRWRYALHQWMSSHGARAIEPAFTAVVLIGDEEYWHGELAGRTPIRRDYLARLVTALSEAEARVIAIDFDLRAMNPDGPGHDHSLYRAETDEFIRVLTRVATRRDVVLSKAVYSRDGRYVRQPDVYDEAGLCPPKIGPSVSDDRKKRHGVSCGYIALPYDLRLVPGPLELPTGEILDSLALAAVRATGRMVRGVKPEGMVGYGSHIPEATFRERGLIVAARDLLADPANQPQLAGKVVIVGGAWSRFAYRRGPSVDTYPSPTGPMPGSLLHANFIEALMDNRVYAPVPELLLKAVELVLLALGAMMFALELPMWRKIVAVVLACVALLLFNYFAIQNLGRFVDILVPLVFLVLHTVVDQVLDWRRDALRFARAKEGR